MRCPNCDNKIYYHQRRTFDNHTKRVYHCRGCEKIHFSIEILVTNTMHTSEFINCDCYIINKEELEMAVPTLTDYEIAVLELDKMIYDCNDGHYLHTLQIIKNIITEKPSIKNNKEELEMKNVATKCEECIHQRICGVEKQFKEAITECPGTTGPFRIEISCEFFRKEQPTRRGGISC